MKKWTGEFYKVEKFIHICDNCQKEIAPDEMIVFDFSWTDGYDNFGGDLEICSIECLQKIVTEINRYSNEPMTDYYFPGGESIKLRAPSEVIKSLILGFK